MVHPFIKFRPIAVALAGVLAASSALAACGSSGSDNSGANANGDYSKITIRIAVRASTAYLPLYAMVDQGYLQKHLPGAKVSYVTVNSSADAATGFVGHRLDATVASSPQAIISSATNVPWRILAGTNTAIVQGITNKPYIKSLKDLKPNDTITVPTPTSINALVLNLAAKQAVGDVNAFKRRTQPLAEPDAMNSLISGTTAVDVAVDPSSTALLSKPGYHAIFSSEQMLRGVVGATLQVATDFGDKNPALRTGLRDAYTDALSFISTNPQQAAQLAVKRKVSPDEKTAVSSIRQNTWTPAITGVDQIERLLVETGLLKSSIAQDKYADPLAIQKQ
jgi:NitT/TauT family transport system substrate-binding protein